MDAQHLTVNRSSRQKVDVACTPKNTRCCVDTLKIVELVYEVLDLGSPAWMSEYTRVGIRCELSVNRPGFAGGSNS